MSKERIMYIIAGFNYDTYKLEVVCCDLQVQLSYFLGLPDLEVWHSVCVALSLNTGEWSIKWGETEYNDVIDGLDTIVRGGGQLFFGQKQGAVAGGFNPASSLRGSLVDVNLYDTETSLDNMNLFLECQDMDDLGDPLVDFMNIEEEFTFGDAGVDVVKVENACQISASYYVVFPEDFTFWNAKHICHVSNGELPQLESEEENIELLQELAPYSGKCGGEESMGSVWLGVISDSENNIWVNYLTKESLPYKNFLDPMVPFSTMCASLVTDGQDADVGKWRHTDCYGYRCMACKYYYGDRTDWRLRGLCQNSPLDRRYKILGGNTSIVIRGHSFSEITLHTEVIDESHRYGYWEITSHLDEKASVKLYRTSLDHYPFGVNEWEADNPVCGKKALKLMLTKCSEDEMTCRDTSCLHNKEYRCDLEVDCEDGSDEEDCNKIKISKSYKPEISPPRKNLDNPLIVYLYIHLLSIKKFDITNFSFTSEVLVYFIWRDSRLKFLNLQTHTWKNKINTKIWEPSVEYLGSDLTSCDVEEQSRSLFAQLEGHPEPQDEQEVLQGGS